MGPAKEPKDAKAVATAVIKDRKDVIASEIDRPKSVESILDGGLTIAEFQENAASNEVEKDTSDSKTLIVRPSSRLSLKTFEKETGQTANEKENATRVDQLSDIRRRVNTPNTSTKASSNADDLKHSNVKLMTTLPQYSPKNMTKCLPNSNDESKMKKINSSPNLVSGQAHQSAFRKINLPQKALSVSPVKSSI